MNREKFAWMLSVVLVSVLAFQIPWTLAKRDRDDDYRFVRTLIDIHRQVDNNYVEPVDQSKLEESAIEGMLGQLDPYTMYVPAANQESFDNMLEGSFRGVGIQLNQTEKGDIEVVTPIDNSPAARAGVEAGDIIVKVNGEDIRNLKLIEVMKKVKGPLGTPVTLTVLHTSGKSQDLTMNREDVVVPTIKGFHRRDDARPTDEDGWDYWGNRSQKIAYIRVTQFTSETYPGMKKVLDRLLGDGMKGLVLDLRFNPGGKLDQAKEVVNLFVRNGVIVKVKGRARPEEVTYAKPEAALKDFPMVVLVNEHSASASEIVAGSLKDNRRALIVGTRTYGKGSVQELIPLEGNGELKLTVAYYYLPSGRLVHRKKDSTDWGVDPDLSVPMDADHEKLLQRQQSALDVIRPSATCAVAQPIQSSMRPATGPTTQFAHAAAQPALPSTQPALPTTQPIIDVQLTAAMRALADDISSGKNFDVPPIPATLPSAAP